MRGVGLLLASSVSGLLGCLLSLLGRLPRGGLLTLLCRLTGGVLRLLGRSLRDLLGLSGYLSDLIGAPAQRSATLLTPASEATNGVLYLLGRSSGDVLGLTRNLACLLGRLTGYLSGLIGRLSSGFL